MGRAERLKMGAIKCEVKTENTQDDTPLPQLMNSEESVKTEDLDIKTERIEDGEEVTEEPKKKKKKKSKPTEEVEEPVEEVPKKKKKKKKKKKRKVEEVAEEQNIEES